MLSPWAMQQQVFTLSWLASQAPTGQPLATGVAKPYKDKTSVTPPPPWDQGTLQGEIDRLGQLIPSWNWKVVWGPKYTPDLLGGPENTMFVAQQLDVPDPVFVIAIAGTNGASPYDLLVEDLDIDPTDWKLKGNDPSRPKVTTGDFDGLKNLLAMGWPFDDVREYLAQISNKGDTTLWFTGHSLGGALAPMLMLALMDADSPLDTSKTNRSLWKQVKLLATAGPSIGNQDFLDRFRRVCGTGNADATFVWNARDVVPHAWNSGSMQALTSPSNIYGITFPLGSYVASMIAREQQQAANQQYVQFQPEAAFTADLQPYTDSQGTGVEWTEDAKFMAQLGYQHLNAYVDHFQCTWFKLDNPCDDPEAASDAVNALCNSGKSVDTLRTAAPAALATAG